MVDVVVVLVRFPRAVGVDGVGILFRDDVAELVLSLGDRSFLVGVRHGDLASAFDGALTGAI